MAPFSLLCTIHGLSGPLLFTLYYSLWKISRKQDFLHRGPPTLNVGQQIYCSLLFTIYYLERRARIPCIAGMSTRGTARMAPFSLLCTIHGLSGPLLFTLYYSRWKISRKQDFLHRGPPTLNVGQQTYRFFAIYYLLFTIYYLLFTIYYLLFTIYYLERRARVPCIAGSRPRGTARMAPFSLLCTIHGLSGPLLFTLYYSLWKISRKRDFLHRGPPTLNVGQQIYCFLLFTIYYLLFRTESEIFLASRAADPEERPEWHPFCLLCTIPYGKFRET